MIDHLNHRETSDTFQGEVFRRGNYRVILCKDRTQWIIQRRKKGAGARWMAISYCVTRNALTRVWTAECSEYAPELSSLPLTASLGCNE